MTPYNQVNWEQFYMELTELQEDHQVYVTREPRWWDFIKDYRFWFEVMKLIFRFIFKI